LYGDGNSTILLADQNFNSSATGVIVLTDGNTPAGAASPGVRDLVIEFAQPSDQTSRANFTTLAAGCTSALGGTGCEYPPAIYVPTGQNGREYIENVQIGNAWDGIIDLSATGIRAYHLRIAALDIGITLANGSDFGTVDDYEHHAQFGLCGYGQPANCNLYNDIYLDGSTFAASLGRGDGTTYSNWRVWSSRIALTSAFTWGSFDTLKLDGANSTLEVAHTNGSPGLQISDVYTTGSANDTTDTHCSIDINNSNANGAVTLTNVDLNNAGSHTDGAGTDFCLKGGYASITGGRIVSNAANAPAITQSGGILSVSGVTFPARGSTAYTVPLVNVTSTGIISFTGNTFPQNDTNAGAIAIATDNAVNNVAANAFGVWTFTPPGTAGNYDATGAWTPTLCFGSSSAGCGSDITYASDLGYWQLHGSVLTAYYAITLTSKGAGTGAAFISGLPFNAKTTADGPSTVVYYSGMAGITSWLGRVFANASYMELYFPNTTAASAIGNSNFTNSSVLEGQTEYFVK
jgi:hypothetical protein